MFYVKVTLTEIKHYQYTVINSEYLNKIRLKDIINNFKKFDTWKIQLTIRINFVSSNDNDEERAIHLTLSCIKLKNGQTYFKNLKL